MRFPFAVRLIVGAVLMVKASLAQPTSEREAQAEDLFQRGKERMAAHDPAKACALFNESYRLDLAGGTLQNLAVCYEDLGKWASAYARFEELRALSKTATPPRQDRIALAEARIAALRSRVSRLFVLLPRESRASEMTVKIDGTAYTDVSLSEGVLVDPGEHQVEVSAPDKIPFVARVDVAGRETAVRAEVRVPPLAATLGRDQGRPPSHPTRSAGFVVGGLGVAALGAGAVFGVLAVSANSAGKEKCQRESNLGAPPGEFDPTSGHCLEGSAALAAANADKSRANDFANVANVLLPIGVLGLAVGTYLFFRGSSGSPRPRAQITPGFGNASLEVRF